MIERIVHSIAICTYNRCRSLERTLQTLAAQVRVNWAQVEVIVIDNNCTDQTSDVVEGFRRRLPIRRVVESAQGLSNARNRALLEFVGDWLIFTDDDVILDQEWLANFTSCIGSLPYIDFAGGRIEPLWPRGAPTWYRADNLPLLDGLLVRFNLGEASREIKAGDPLFFGASFAISRNIVSRVGKFRVDLGVNSQEIGRGEETDYLLRAQRTGARGWYIGECKCWHPVDHERLKFVYLFRYGIASAIAHRKIVDQKAAGSLFAAASFLARGLFQVLKGRGDRFRQCIINAGIQAGLSKKNSS